ncbi:hypothetical protein, partial [Providencia stuartii]|uniref:hypothetical protein n=1 Tax=Providencia stuartii TaxID=588 RepID=UPI001952A2AA
AYWSSIALAMGSVRIDDAPLLRGLGSLATLGMLVALFSPWPALSIAGFSVVGLGLSVMVLE